MVRVTQVWGSVPPRGWHTHLDLDLEHPTIEPPGTRQERLEHQLQPNHHPVPLGEEGGAVHSLVRSGVRCVCVRSPCVPCLQIPLSRIILCALPRTSASSRGVAWSKRRHYTLYTYYL